MTKTIIQTITNILDEDGNVISSYETKMYSVKPDAGKYLLDTKTGERHYYGVCVNKQSKVKDFEEVEEGK